MTDLKTIRQLIKLMVDHELAEIDLEGEGGKVKLKRGGGGGAPAGGPVHYVQSPPAATDAATQGRVAPASTVPPQPEEPTPASEAVGPSIDSPMVGTFYTASSPEAAAFVSVGDTVGPDTVVCIIEAMKVFNEIKAEKAGTIEKMLVKNGEQVEFGQPLFKIKPS